MTIAWPDDSLGWFTDQAYNPILLADDEARMLSHTAVEPEHLLLATTRRGNAERLLAGLVHAIHDQILRIKGYGEQLELRPQRSPASEEALRRAVTAAADRGHSRPKHATSNRPPALREFSKRTPGLVATVRSRDSWDRPPAQFVQPRYPRATDIFSTDARRIVAKDVLAITERVGHRPLTTGHILIALLESPDEHTREIACSLPDVQEIPAAVIDAVPGELSSRTRLSPRSGYLAGAA